MGKGVYRRVSWEGRGVNQVQPNVFRSSFEKGETIFPEGEVGHCAYLVETGAVNIMKVMEGREVKLATIGENGVFGEMALIDAKPRMASAVAASPTSCFVIPAARFHSKMDGLDPFMRGLIRVLTTNLRVLSERYASDVDIEALFREGGGI